MNNNRYIAVRILDGAGRAGLARDGRYSAVVHRLTRITRGESTLPALVTESEKTKKGEKVGIMTGITYLSPAHESGRNFCPFASHGCRTACLGHSSGRLVTAQAAQARIIRSWWLRFAGPSFAERLAVELRNLVRRAGRRGLRAYYRPNGTSDLGLRPFTGRRGRANWPPPRLLTVYDYTKSVERAIAAAQTPSDYHITFSRSERNDTDCLRVLRAGGNVAVVFGGGTLPTTWNGFPVVDGDVTDGRPDDDRGVVVGLSAKGAAKRDQSGFVVH